MVLEDGGGLEFYIDVEIYQEECVMSGGGCVWGVFVWCVCRVMCE